MQGLALLVLYNLMFVLPLAFVLLFASNPKVIDGIERFQHKHKKTYKTVLGVLMVAFGLLILYGGFM